MPEYWCKISVNFDQHPKAVLAGFMGKELFLYLCRLNSRLRRDGDIPALYMAPEYIADQWRPPGGAEAVADALVACVRAELVALDEQGNCTLVGWNKEEWGSNKTPAERSKKYRDKRNTAASRGVTQRNANRPDREESRLDQIPPTPGVGATPGKCVAANAAAVIPIGSRARPGSTPAAPRSPLDERARSVADETARFFNDKCRAHGVARRAKGATHFKRVRRLLKEGAAPIQLRLVVLWALEGPECWPKHETLSKHLQLETLLKGQSSGGSRTFWDYLERAEEWCALKFGQGPLAKLGGDDGDDAA